MNRDKLRRLKHLMHKHDPFHYQNREKIEISLAESKALKYGKRSVTALTEILEIHKLIEELKITDSSFGVNNLWLDMHFVKTNSERIRQLKPPRESRDNKGVYVGSGYSKYNANKVRYPSKKRSLRVWKTFYKMFPRLAEKDKWDGKTSIKMK